MSFRSAILSTILTLLLHVSGASAQQPSEKVLFSFQTTKNKLCSLSLDTLSNTMIYRFGTRIHVELEVLDDLNDLDTVFTYVYYFRPGGIENLGLDIQGISFKRSDYVYTVYHTLSAEFGESVGIKVLNEETGTISIIEGKVNTINGNLGFIVSNELIPVVWDGSL